MKTMELKNNPITKIMKSSLTDLPSPSPINSLWNMGFLLGMILSIQIISGILASSVFIPETQMAFESSILMIKNINSGWIIRYLHSNSASAFFILMYVHMARGIYFLSPANKKKTWMSGLIIMIITMAAAFLGYVLPWGQMSFWAATVITGTLSAIPMIGESLTSWIWGGPSISQPTLTRFFSLHFLIPMILIMMAVMHLMFLHESGSSNPTNSNPQMDKIKFNPLFSLKDSTMIILIMTLMAMMVSHTPNILSDMENFNTANPLMAPLHIQPEWYFLFMYVVLRSLPSKLGGVLALASSILIMIMFITKKSKSTKFKILKKTKLWTLLSILLILTWIGAKTVEQPFENIGKLYSSLYFLTIMMV